MLLNRYLINEIISGHRQLATRSRSVLEPRERVSTNVVHTKGRRKSATMSLKEEKSKNPNHACASEAVVTPGGNNRDIQTRTSELMPALGTSYADEVLRNRKSLKRRSQKKNEIENLKFNFTTNSEWETSRASHKNDDGVDCDFVITGHIRIKANTLSEAQRVSKCPAVDKKGLFLYDFFRMSNFIENGTSCRSVELHARHSFTLFVSLSCWPCACFNIQWTLNSYLYGGIAIYHRKQSSFKRATLSSVRITAIAQQPRSSVAFTADATQTKIELHCVHMRRH